jgi:hypothetical protein
MTMADCIEPSNTTVGKKRARSFLRALSYSQFADAYARPNSNALISCVRFDVSSAW